MESALISNPPYNMKWSPPALASYDIRFYAGVPPKNNANYAFILSGISLSDKSCFLLPTGVLSPTGVELEILKSLVEDNLLEAVISLPDNMFESTNIATVILYFNLNKDTEKVTFIDMKQTFVEIEREQNGQFGGASHENRVYKKTLKVLTDEHIEKALAAIKERTTEEGFCRTVGIQAIRDNNYNIMVSRYIDYKYEEKFRSFAEIATDYNRITQRKNEIKLIVNETIAKSLGIYEAFKKDNVDISKSFESVGEKVEKEDFISFTKNAEFKIVCRTNTGILPELILMFLSMWKNCIMIFNNEQNRILAEFRDTLLPKLMSGEIQINDKGEETSGQDDIKPEGSK